MILQGWAFYQTNGNSCQKRKTRNDSNIRRNIDGKRRKEYWPFK